MASDAATKLDGIDCPDALTIRVGGLDNNRFLPDWEFSPKYPVKTAAPPKPATAAKEAIRMSCLNRCFMTFVIGDVKVRSNQMFWNFDHAKLV